MLKPLGDRVVVRRLAAEERTGGGIYIPESAREKQLRAEVVSVGPGRVLDNGRRIEPSVKQGDIAVIGRYAGTETREAHEVFGMQLNDELLVVREDDILGIVEE